MPLDRQIRMADPLNSTPVPQALRTALVILLDESGSMAQCLDQTISGFNEYVDGLRAHPDVYLTMLTFSSERAVLGGTSPQASLREVISRRPVAEAPTLSHPETFRPEGNTPLLDAVGGTIERVIADQVHHPVDRTLMVILTDGQENASREWTKDRVKDRITELERGGTWTFVFLGADQDAWTQASQMGTQHANVMSYASARTHEAYRVTGQATAAYLASPARNTGDFWQGNTPPPPEEQPKP